jgi:hypothetical protein
MPLYEYRKNAENLVAVDAATRDSLVTGPAAVADALLAPLVKNAEQTGLSMGCDAWYGVDLPGAAAALLAAGQRAGLQVEVLYSHQFFQSPEAIDAYRKPYVGEDPSFGWVNDTGTLADLLDAEKVQQAVAQCQATAAGAVTVVIGPGANCQELAAVHTRQAYLDYTMQPLLWQMWDGALVPFGQAEQQKDYFWKNYYYNDFYLCARHGAKRLPGVSNCSGKPTQDVT